MRGDKAFKMIVVGPTDCGKTRYVLGMVETELMGKFDHIHIICSTLEWNKTYLEWKYRLDPNVNGVQCDIDDMELELRKAWYTFAGSRTLIIIDDCAAGKDSKKKTSELAKQVTTGRHALISTIIITQQLTSISKFIRDNLTTLVVFPSGNSHDMNTVVNDYMHGVDKEEIHRVLSEIRSGPHISLEIMTNWPYKYKVTHPHEVTYSSEPRSNRKMPMLEPA